MVLFGLSVHINTEYACTDLKTYYDSSTKVPI